MLYWKSFYKIILSNYPLFVHLSISVVSDVSNCACLSDVHDLKLKLCLHGSHSRNQLESNRLGGLYKMRAVSQFTNLPGSASHLHEYILDFMSAGSTPAGDIQSHLYRAFLDGRTSDVALHVRGSWEGIYKLHRVVLIQAVSALVNQC